MYVMYSISQPGSDSSCRFQATAGALLLVQAMTSERLEKLFSKRCKAFLGQTKTELSFWLVMIEGLESVID